jgi:hypothetical protein
MYFRARPALAEARQYKGPESLDQITSFVGETLSTTRSQDDEEAILIDTVSGPSFMVPGDWVVKTGSGGFQVVAANHFKKLYSPSSADSVLCDFSREEAIELLGALYEGITHRPQNFADEACPACRAGDKLGNLLGISPSLDGKS